MTRNKNIKLLFFFFIIYSTVEFYFWKRENEGKEGTVDKYQLEQFERRWFDVWSGEEKSTDISGVLVSRPTSSIS